jgi:predicted GNAT superfamily acetyltransferase
MPEHTIRMLETPEDMSAVEALQRLVWPGSETEIVPTHMLITAVHNGGIVLGAFINEELAGFVFGFPGLDMLPDGPHPKHCSHMMGVHPQWRDSGLGFALKRAQWQTVRHQGLDHITWTYDPLLSRNAYLNIAKLGAICNTYRRSEYGDLRDGLNAGLPTDRFQVDWWLNTHRVQQRLSRRARGMLKLAHFTKAKTQPLYTPQTDSDGLLRVPERFSSPGTPLLLAEIPSDFTSTKSSDLSLARDWRFFIREVFETIFAEGYFVTDFIFDSEGDLPHSLYILTDGHTILEDAG